MMESRVRWRAPDVAQVINASGIRFGAEVDVAIVGGGAAGLVAALRAREAGAEVLVIERDALPRGSTALSAGLIPAPATRFQRAAGIVDSTELFASDILRKAKGEPDAATVKLLAGTIGPAIEWLADEHGLPFSVIDNFTYPGHSAMRMHGLPGRSGGELMDHLTAAAERAGVVMLTEAVADTLIRGDEALIRGVGVARPDGSRETMGCRALILACNGYGGNPALVTRHAPEMADALYFGHAGNRGDAVLWGEELGAGLRHLSGYQGHGSVAHPHGILITWATVTEGGFQVNATGRRFHNEATGYSEAAAAVCAQPGGVAWQIFDARIAAIARQFEDFRNAEAQGALISGGDWSDLAGRMRIDAAALESAAAEASSLKDSCQTDAFGRDWAGVPRLLPPYHAVRVTGALFHTQGGLEVDSAARVLRQGGKAFTNLFAAGGAACGVSGSDASGYLSGNGLLTAVGYGFIAGTAAAAAGDKGRQ
jgi:fumarate reductase flavoprotein subunit